jgi:RNA processing factor Prp31
MNQSDYIRLAKESIQHSFSVKDKIIRLVDMYDDLNKSSNILFQTLSSYLFLFYPDAAVKLDLKSFVSANSFSAEIKGMKLSAEDENFLNSGKRILKDILQLRDNVKEELIKVIEKEYPNASKLIDPILLARMIKVATKPINLLTASELQALGNPEAFYRKNKPPKFGILGEAKYNTKGLRKLSYFLTIALKIDAERKQIDEAFISKAKESLKKYELRD